MQTIHAHQLVSIIGGQNSDTVTTPIVTADKTRTDYGMCVDTVVAQTAKQYPDTRPSWGPFTMPLTSDDNAAPRAAATISNVLETCGQP